MNLVIKKSKNFQSPVDFINAVSSTGLSNNSCMILELLMLGKSYDRIMHVLLFTKRNFKELIEETYMFLDSFNMKHHVKVLNNIKARQTTTQATQSKWPKGLRWLQKLLA